ncbi:LysR substrate-binding domain-containing protein [Kribbella sp. NPDC026611]|uniref:LysR family transcriptional regulator n=1 Tax=Kribbella sp. NPDC026611 TaxID=3154911 RepID=UPI0033CAF21B
MELRQLRYLDAIARRRSFTSAAQELHVAQSALSQQVQRLERELGVELLRRTTRRVEVTDAGEVVLARVRRTLAEVDGLRADLDAISGLMRGRLRLGGVPPIGDLHPAVLVAEFTRAHPGVNVTVHEDVAFALLGQLHDGTLDLVIALVAHEAHDALDGVRLLDDELVLITAPQHRLARAKHVRVDRLSGEPVVAYGSGSALRDVLTGLMPDSRIVAEANDQVTIRELVAGGLGVSLMPRSVVAAHDASLAIRPLTPRQTVPISLIWRAGERPTPAAEAFRAHVLAAVHSGRTAPRRA